MAQMGAGFPEGIGDDLLRHTGVGAQNQEEITPTDGATAGDQDHTNHPEVLSQQGGMGEALAGGIWRQSQCRHPVQDSEWFTIRFRILIPENGQGGGRKYSRRSCQDGQANPIHLSKTFDFVLCDCLAARPLGSDGKVLDYQFFMYGLRKRMSVLLNFSLPSLSSLTTSHTSFCRRGSQRFFTRLT